MQRKGDRMREFKHYPSSDKCLICNTNEDKPCILVGIDGTQEDNIIEAIPVHSDCIELRYSKQYGILYQSLAKGAKDDDRGRS